MLEALQGYGFQAVSPLFIFKRFIIHCLQFGFRFHLLKKKIPIKVVINRFFSTLIIVSIIYIIWVK